MWRVKKENKKKENKTFQIGASGSGNVTIGNSTSPLTLTGSTTTFSSPLTLGSAPGTVALSGATGISLNNTLGYGVRVNTISIVPSNYNVNNSLASILTSYDGVYLATWAVQQQITTAPTGINSNITFNNVSAITTAGQFGFSNWGMTKMTNIIFGTSGSAVTQLPAGTFCNITYIVDGGSGFSTPAVTFSLTRIG